MIIAVPVANKMLSMHFGHCEEFDLYEVDEETKSIKAVRTIKAPAHEPGLLPKWLGELGATVIICGGMGMRAQSLFAQQGIETVVGAPCDVTVKLVEAFLAGTLAAGENICDH